jgi:hypothetical protein
MTEKVAIPSTSERGSKRRLRSIKRKAPGEKGPPIRAAQGQRKASRGTRLRGRRS